MRAFGWHCILVADEHHPQHAKLNVVRRAHPVYDAAFAYTVGLWLTFEHPEIVLVGRWQHAHPIVGSVVSLIREGRRLSPGDTCDEVLAGYEVSFGAVSERWRTELLTYADWANGRRHFEAVQLILPEASGHLRQTTVIWRVLARQVQGVHRLRGLLHRRVRPLRLGRSSAYADTPHELDTEQRESTTGQTPRPPGRLQGFLGAYQPDGHVPSDTAMRQSLAGCSRRRADFQ